MEAEYIVGVTGVSECDWIRQLLMEIVDQQVTPLVIVDNKSVLSTMKIETLSSAAKHIALRYHFVND